MAGDNELVFVPLGGVGEIGMNLALYGYGPARAREWMIVDVGVTFPGPELPGVDLVLPDIRFIEGELDRLRGIVITHAHEDHYGALLELWPRLKAPVWMTPFSAGTVKTSPRASTTARIPVGETPKLWIRPPTFSTRGRSVARSLTTWTLTSRGSPPASGRR